MLAVLAAHAGLAVLAGLLAPRLGPRAFYVAALAPLSGVVLALAAAPDVLAGRAWGREVPWVPGLDLTVALRLDALSLLMLVLVSGVGTLIFLYCASYADRDSPLVRFAATLTAFAGAMVGLVLADDVILLYVFWEATTITSYLLVGLSDEDRTARRAAMQALLITTLGGLAMLLGLIVLAQQAGTTRLSEIVAEPPSGALVTAALLLVLLGALTKSAQVPFHPWLPAAMAAPTPVSAYLHAAAMVKAGVYLVARLAPGFAELSWWRPLLVSVGIATMLLGGWRSLRQHDLKSLMAYSTVSQLGFLTAVAAWGSAESAVAAALLLLAHGFAKAALFLTVGAVDHAAHTRDLRLLDGLGRRMPVLAVAATVAALSLGGVPLLLGFIAKEEVYTAFAEAEGTFATVALAGLVLGSVLTLGYAGRFLWGAFAGRPQPSGAEDLDAVPAGERAVAAQDVHAPGAGLVAPVVVLAAAAVALGVLPALLDPLVSAVAAPYPGAGEPVHLALWHGVTPALLLSVLTLALGVALVAARRRWGLLQRSVGRVLPQALDADRTYDAAVYGLDSAADVVTGRTQSGSLPRYLGVIALSATLLPLGGLALRGADLAPGVIVDRPVQIGVGVVIALAALAAARTSSRFAAVLMLGGVGYGVAALYVLQGAPDLALTQFLVETLSVVIFLLVLRLLPRRFPVQTRRSRLRRAAVAVTVGVGMTVLTLAATSVRVRPSVAEEFVARSKPEGGGLNVVNVILVDFRGLDTLGEITVVLIAALGMSSLVLTLRRGRPGADGPHDAVRREEPEVRAP
ncbi:multicomponent Na+:H+ antiporter subunit A [Kineococcus xinjiangensis]|uniref:Multicomponent Na+:H+ antiporter subunit A n=1 Tax=Kineococcus xinjiangensis TaxID=512762 RepID=A0A2S6IGV8_9ACTN|nr:hydrogen gas-evolving membrane-bound hydrogenase subunit E [Kineococcus xinjiangensis]PPK93416.1 multicomponent Na+:H+ antiporter subunit A [Kineococcus xinjiangensis]